MAWASEAAGCSVLVLSEGIGVGVGIVVIVLCNLNRGGSSTCVSCATIHIRTISQCLARFTVRDIDQILGDCMPVLKKDLHECSRYVHNALAK